MVRAKFKVVKIESTQTERKIDQKGQWTRENLKSAELRTIVMTPVSGGSDENQLFWDATPSGEIKLGVLNQEVWATFVLGDEYYVDFHSAGGA